MLVIDIGNTNITHAIFEDGTLKRVLRVSTEVCRDADAYWKMISSEIDFKPEALAIASVRTDITESIREAFFSHFGLIPLVIDNATDMGIKMIYHTPQTLGVDRLINVAAAYHIYKKAAIVVDMGSATTIDYVTDRGEFLGGVIAPGILSAYKGLLMQAPRLPEIRLETPDAITGPSTDACLRSGVLIGHALMVNEMVRLMSQEQGISPVVIVTGGFVSLVQKWMNQEFIIDKEFTLKGIYTIYTRIKQ